MAKQTQPSISRKCLTLRSSLPLKYFLLFKFEYKMYFISATGLHGQIYADSSRLLSLLGSQGRWVQSYCLKSMQVRCLGPLFMLLLKLRTPAPILSFFPTFLRGDTLQSYPESEFRTKRRRKKCPCTVLA